MILEGLITTTNPDGTPHLAPMGPSISDDARQLVLRPFQTSTTFANLKRTGVGVFHVTDDVELLAYAAVGRLETLPALRRADAIDGWIVENACRWMAFRVQSSDSKDQRAIFTAEVLDRGIIREFFGFNRGKHAVVEAAILATRVHLLAKDDLIDQLARLQPLVDKTGGPPERRAFEFLHDYIRAELANAASRREASHSLPRA
jgi:hypothetical protein